MAKLNIGDSIIVKVRDGLSFSVTRTFDHYFIQCIEYKKVYITIKKPEDIEKDTTIDKLLEKLNDAGVDVDPRELVLAFEKQFLKNEKEGNEEGSEPPREDEEDEDSEEDKELEKLLPTPSFEDVLGTLIDETGKNVLMNTWRGLRRALANFIRSDYRIVPIRVVPHMLLIEALKNTNRFVYYDLVDGEHVVAAKTSDGDYAIFMLSKREVPLGSNDETSELIERLYTRYGCFINEDGELTCLAPVENRIYRFNGLKNLAYVKDTELNLEFIRIDTTILLKGKPHLTSYAFDTDFTGISNWAKAAGIITKPSALAYLLKVLKIKGAVTDHYAVGFMYEDGSITWSPGIVNYEPRKLTLKEATEEAQKLRAVIDKIKSAYENPEPPLLFIGLNIAYTFFRPYRKLLNNADTPVPITFGFYGLGKTTITSTINRMMGELANRVEFITEGHNIAETIPRLGGFMTSTTLPGVLDDLILTDKLAEIILQLGASTSNAISIARARTRGPGLSDKLPLLRMLFPVMNAESEREVYDQFYDVLRNSKFLKAQVKAIINRRILAINMNDAFPREDIDLRKELQGVAVPDLLALLRYVVENMQSDLINAMMQRGYPDVEGKHLSFLWFAYLFWKYILPKSVLTQVKFDDVAEPIKSVAEKREEERKYRFKIEIEEYKERRKPEVADSELLITAYSRWRQAQRAQGRTFNSIADEIATLLEDPYRAGLHITRPKDSLELLEIKEDLVKLICKNPAKVISKIEEIDDLIHSPCEKMGWVSDRLYAVLSDLFMKGRLVVYVLQEAFKTDNDAGIGKISTLMGKNAKNVTLPSGEPAYGFRFTLPELLTVLYPSLRTKSEETPGKIGVGTDSVGSGGAQRVSASSDLRGTEHVGETEREGETEHRGTESAQTQAPPTYTEAPIPTGFGPTPENPGVNLVNVSADCETECASKYPVVSPIAQIKYNQCIEECRQRRSMQSITEQLREAKQTSQTSEASESEEQGSTEQAGEASKQGEMQQSQQVGQPQEVQNQQVQQPSGEESIGRLVITPEEYEKLKKKVLSGGNESQSQGGSFDWGSVESVGDGS